MDKGGLLLVVGSLVSAAVAFIWVAVRLENGPGKI